MKLKKIFLICAVTLFLMSSFCYAQINSYCGDGYTDTEFGEECDDGNFENRDGCSNYCKIEDMEFANITWVSIEEEATGVSTLTNKITVNFSEAVDPESINSKTVKLKQYSREFNIGYDLNENGTELTITVNEDLLGELQHSLVITGFKDLAGNINTNVFVRNFTTGEYIDHTPPNIIANPEGGEYNVTQSFTLTPYIGEITTMDEFIDKTAKIYYTTTGAIPTTKSDIYDGKAISISKNTTIRYFGVDEKGNTSGITTQIYTFSCAERLNAKEIESYPSCEIKECNHGYKLTNNVCVVDYNFDENDYRTNSATAPLLGSDTPMMISTKPALYITPEHQGVIPRPIIFKDLIGGTIINFERDTKISKINGESFWGYIKPPDNLYSKDYPINYGFTFKSIFQFIPIGDEELTFNPAYTITIPFTDRYDPEVSVTVFTYNPETQEYTKYNSELTSINPDSQEVTITSNTTNTFFIAQPGKNYNKIVFQDTAEHWSKNYVEELYRKGIVKGRDKGIFAPDDILTRAEFTKIALNAISEEIDPMENVESAPFSDVALYAWYVPYIKRAKEIGLINGYPNGEFQPDNPINKAEAIAILMRAFDFDLYSAGARIDNYADVLTNQWYFPAVNFAIQNKLTEGIRLPNGKIMDVSFGPARNITRGEMAKLAIKTIELKEDIDQ